MFSQVCTRPSGSVNLLLLALLSFACSIATCAHLPTTDEQRQPRLLKLPVVRSTNRGIFGDRVDARDFVNVPLSHRSDVAYYAQLDIGSPVQTQYVQLDTGSFELWVNPDCAELDNSADIKFCQSVGHYDPRHSDTSSSTGESKTLVYGIGMAVLQYVTDNVALAGTDITVEQLKFGVASHSEDQFAGILGIGYGEGVNLRYKNFVDQLADQGLTETKAFSLALGSKSEEEGAIIFGGLDTGKFTERLVTLPLIPPSEAPDGVARYWVDLQYVSHTTETGETWKYGNSTTPVFLDSGATLSMLPPSVANDIAADFGSPGVDETGLYLVDCSFNDMPGTLDFAFDQITIHVPNRELIRSLVTTEGEEVCYLGIAPTDDYVMLGDSMLRSAYVIFDQTNHAVHIQQYVHCGNNEIEITADTDFTSIVGECQAPSWDTPEPEDASTIPTATFTETIPVASATDPANGGSVMTAGLPHAQMAAISLALAMMWL